MPAFEVFFKARHHCPFGGLSAKYPSAQMFVWCNSAREVVEIVLPDRSEYKKMREEITAIVDIFDQSFDGRSIYLITKKCNCTFGNSIAVRLEAHNILCLLPVTYEAGWESYHAIAWRHNDLKRFMNSAAKMPAEIIITRKSALSNSIRALLPVPLGGLFADLTKKQIDALLACHMMGYFEFPRKMNVKNIAETRRVARTTFQEHLTKAENKLVASLVPYLRLLRAKPEHMSQPTPNA